MLSEAQSYTLIHTGGDPGTTEIFSSLVQVQRSKSAATELLKPLSPHRANATTPVPPCFSINSHQSDELPTALHWFESAVLPGSYNLHPLMTLEDAPGSAEYTVTGLQGKSYTFLCVSLDNVWNMSFEFAWIPGYCYNKLTSLIRLFFKGVNVGRNEFMLRELPVVKARKRRDRWEGCKASLQVTTGNNPTEWRDAQEIRGNRPRCQQTARARNIFKDMEMAPDSFP